MDDQWVIIITFDYEMFQSAASVPTYLYQIEADQSLHTYSSWSVVSFSHLFWSLQYLYPIV